MKPGARSARLCIALTWSVLVVVVAAVLLVVLNVVVAAEMADQPVTRQAVTARRLGPFLVIEEREVVVFDELERQVNERTMRNLRRVSAVAVLGLFPASLAVGWVVAARVLAPVERITRATREIEATDLSRRIGSDGPDDELTRLAATIDGLLDRVDAAVGEQREFLQNASHELRTPLAVAATNLDVALRSEDPDQVRRRAETARRSIGRVARLVDDLLVHARQVAAGHVSADRRTEVDLDELAAAAIDDLAEVARGRGLLLRRRGGGGGRVDVDAEAVRRALTNLVDNAVRLAPPGSVVEVASGRRDRWAWLAVRDQGPGIAPDDQDDVWRRFWKTREGGTGLGLAIVRQTAEAHSGGVAMRSALGEGSTFAIWLPVDGHAADDPPTEVPEL